MKQIFFCLSVLVTAVLVMVPADEVNGQTGQASGGRITSDAAPTTRSTNKTTVRAPVKTAVKPGSRSTPSSTKASAQSSAAPESIEGKWWTTGKGFGDSEVVFTQNGAQVSGVIRYADGRAGTLAGTMTGNRLQHTWSNSSGEAGAGWLELSWNNFLGGPWRNQRVRDGSWTLSRIAGKWCFGGNRNRIRTVTHNARGEVYIVTEDGSRDEGRLEGPLIFLDSDFGSIQGTMNFRQNRVEWSTGFFWTWCGR